jgi:DNA-binding SARP family transcriptional activator/tetratricopeptide (TPR) repeat protein
MQKAIAPAELENVIPLEQGPLPDLTRQVSRPIVRIHLLGPMRANSYMGDNILPRGRKARALLGCLCLAPGQRLARGRLASMLWDRVPEFQARASFRQAVRELVVAFGSFAPELIECDRENISLSTVACWIDVSALLSPERSGPKTELANYCVGELLEGLDGVSVAFDQWLLSERTRFTEQRRALLEAELNQARGANKGATERAEIARRLILFDPTHEGASRILMRALADMGERGQSLREYARCKEALNAALEVEPSAETHALYEAIRSFSGRDVKGIVAVPEAAPRNKKARSPRAPETQRSRLRVGVLPFLATPSPGEEDLALCLSQEVAAALARFRWFDVIAPMALMHRPVASFTSEEQLRPRETDYVVDGALSSSGEKFQISVRLLDLTRYASPVWSSHFELDSRALNKIDEMITAKIVAQIDPVILFIEGQPKRSEKFGAAGLLLRAIPLIYTWEKEKYEEAGKLIDRALDMEPDNAMAAAWAAYWHLFYVGQGWSPNIENTFAIVRNYAVRAIRLDPENAEALGIYAHVCAFADRDFKSALHYYDRALRLNPNLAIIWALSAPTYCYIGQPDKALKQLERYRELAPFHPYFFWVETLYTIAYYFLGDYEQAIQVGRRAVTTNPEFVNGYKPLLAALGHLRRREEAKPFLDKLMALETNFSVQRFAREYPIEKEADRERYMEDLRLAGVPEN